MWNTIRASIFCFFFAFIFRTKSFFFSFLNGILLFNFLCYCIALKEQNSHHNIFFRCCLEFRERCPSLWTELIHKYGTKSKKNFLSICVKWCLKCIRFPKSYFAIWIHHPFKVVGIHQYAIAFPFLDTMWLLFFFVCLFAVAFWSYTLLSKLHSIYT